MTSDTLKALVQAFAHCRLDYCNVNVLSAAQQIISSNDYNQSEHCGSFSVMSSTLRP